MWSRICIIGRRFSQATLALFGFFLVSSAVAVAPIVVALGVSLALHAAMLAVDWLDDSGSSPGAGSGPVLRLSLSGDGTVGSYYANGVEYDSADAACSSYDGPGYSCSGGLNCTCVETLSDGSTTQWPELVTESYTCPDGTTAPTAADCGVGQAGDGTADVTRNPDGSFDVSDPDLSGVQSSDLDATTSGPDLLSIPLSDGEGYVVNESTGDVTLIRRRDIQVTRPDGSVTTGTSVTVQRYDSSGTLVEEASRIEYADGSSPQSGDVITSSGGVQATISDPSEASTGSYSGRWPDASTYSLADPSGASSDGSGSTSGGSGSTSDGSGSTSGGSGSTSDSSDSSDGTCSDLSDPACIGSFSGPGVDQGLGDFGDILGNFWSRVQDAPILSVPAQFEAAFSGSSGACAPLSVDVFDQTVSTSVHCEIWDGVKGLLSAVMIAVYGLVGLRILLSA